MDSFLDNFDYTHPPAAQLYNLTSVFGRRIVTLDIPSSSQWIYEQDHGVKVGWDISSLTYMITSCKKLPFGKSWLFLVTVDPETFREKSLALHFHLQFFNTNTNKNILHKYSKNNNENSVQLSQSKKRVHTAVHRVKSVRPATKWFFSARYILQKIIIKALKSNFSGKEFHETL